MLSQQSALAARPKPKFLSFFSSPPDPVDTWSDIVRKYIAAQQPAAKRLFFDLIEDPFTQRQWNLILKNYGNVLGKPQTAFGANCGLIWMSKCQRHK